MGKPEKLKLFLSEINKICEQTGKKSGDLTILGASKSQRIDSIEQALSEGVHHFGENFLQEAEPKILEIGNRPTWHFIGAIQSRKAKKIASLFDWVQTIDRIKVAKKLNQHRPLELNKLNVCVQVNPDNEEHKSGIPLSDCKKFISELVLLERLEVRGLMSIPKANKDFEQQRKVFGRIRSCFEDLKSTYLNWIPFQWVCLVIMRQLYWKAPQ